MFCCTRSTNQVSTNQVVISSINGVFYYHKQQPTFYQGEEVTGDFIVSTAEPLTVGSITVDVTGVGHCNFNVMYTPTDSETMPYTTEYNQHHYYVKVNQAVIPFTTDGCPVTTNATFKVSFKIPYGDFPSTVGISGNDNSLVTSQEEYEDVPSHWTSVGYSLTFHIYGISGVLLHSTSAIPLNVIAHYNYGEAGSLPMIQCAAYNITFCDIFTRMQAYFPIYMITNKTVYFPGEPIHVTYWIDGSISPQYIGLLRYATFQLQFVRVIKFCVNSTNSSNNFLYVRPADQTHLISLQTAPIQFDVNGTRFGASIVIPVGLPPTFEYVPDASSSWEYGVAIKIRFNENRWEYSLPYCPVIVNSVPPTASLIYPLKSLPANYVNAQRLLATNFAPGIQPIVYAPCQQAYQSMVGGYQNYTQQQPGIVYLQAQPVGQPIIVDYQPVKVSDI